MKPEEYLPEFYSFEKYITKHRYLTFWYQIKEIVDLNPSTVLEVGVGSGTVSSFLRHRGIKVTTVDINPSLFPDVVGSVLELDSIFHESEFDLVLCARVLHHLEFDKFQVAIEKLNIITCKYCLLTLPIDDFSLNLMLRYTSSNFRTISMRFPLIIKKMMFSDRYLIGENRQNSLWKVNDSEKTAHSNISKMIKDHFRIKKNYRIPEDGAHLVYLLEKQKNQ